MNQNSINDVEMESIIHTSFPEHKGLFSRIESKLFLLMLFSLIISFIFLLMGVLKC